MAELKTVYDPSKTESQNLTALMLNSGVPAERIEEVQVEFTGITEEGKIGLTLSVTTDGHPFITKFGKKSQKFELTPVRPVTHNQLMGLDGISAGDMLNPTTGNPEYYNIVVSDTDTATNTTIEQINAYLLERYKTSHDGSEVGFAPITNMAQLDASTAMDYTTYEGSWYFSPKTGTNVATGKTELYIRIIPDITGVTQTLQGKAGFFSPYFTDESSHLKPFVYPNGQTKLSNHEMIAITRYINNSSLTAANLLMVDPKYQTTHTGAIQVLEETIKKNGGLDQYATGNEDGPYGPRVVPYENNDGEEFDDNIRFINGTLVYNLNTADIPVDNPTFDPLEALGISGQATYTMLVSQLFQNMMDNRFKVTQNEYFGYDNITNMSAQNLHDNQELNPANAILNNTAIKDIQPKNWYTEVSEGKIPEMSWILQYDMSSLDSVTDEMPTIYDITPPTGRPMVTAANVDQMELECLEIVRNMVNTSIYIPKITSFRTVTSVGHTTATGDEFFSYQISFGFLVEAEIVSADFQPAEIEFMNATIKGHFAVLFDMDADPELYIAQPEGYLNGFEEDI